MPAMGKVLWWWFRQAQPPELAYIVEQVNKQPRKRAKHRMRYLVVVEPVETTIGLFGIAPFRPF